MNEKEPKQPIGKGQFAAKFAVSGLELAFYIILPMIPGYLIGSYFGVLGKMIGLTAGAILGLLLAVRRALKMTL